MPKRPPTICTKAGCGRVAPKGSRCSLHPYTPPPRNRARERERDRERGSARARGYDKTWEKLRAAKLADDPLCEHCEKQGRTTPAQDVDHIIPIRERPDLRLARDNLQSLCRPCHNRKTARERSR